MKLEMQNRRLEPIGIAKRGKTRRLTGTGPDLAHQLSARRGFGQVWNLTNLFLRSKPRLLGRYPDPLLTLHTALVKPVGAVPLFNRWGVLLATGAGNPPAVQD